MSVSYGQTVRDIFVQRGGKRKIAPTRPSVMRKLLFYTKNRNICQPFQGERRKFSSFLLKDLLGLRRGPGGIGPERLLGVQQAGDAGESSEQAPYPSLPPFGESSLILLLLLSPPKPLRWVSAGTPELPGRKAFIYPANRPRRGAPCPPGIPGRRRRRWRCGSSCRRSPAAQRPPRCRRRR